MADTAAGIGVGDVDQLADGVLAVADDVRRHPLGDGDDLVVDDQDAVVLAGDEASRRRPSRSRLSRVRDREELAHLVFVGEVDADAAAVVAVERLEHHRVADPPRRRDRFVGVADDQAARHGNADLVQQAVGQLLVAGDVDGDVGGVAR